MPRFRLLTGSHIADNAKGESVTYLPGEVIESDTDLVRKFGPTKFQPIDEDFPTVPSDNVNSFPGGQVSEGVQVSRQGQPAVTSQYTQEELAQKLRAQSQAEAQRRGREDQAGQDAEEKHAQSSKAVGESGGLRQPPPPEDTQGAKGTGAPQPKKARPDFDKMSTQDMTRYAEEEEIDLKGAKTRGEILKLLKSS